MAKYPFDNPYDIKESPRCETGRDTIWTSQDGTERKVCDLTDDHLVKIVNWILEHPKNYRQAVYSVMLEEVIHRKLKVHWTGGKLRHTPVSVTYIESLAEEV